MSGVEDPVASEVVRRVRRGLMRTYGAAPRRLARPLTVDEIRTIIGGIGRSPRSGSATLRSSCSAMPRRCAAPRSLPSPSSTSSTSPPASCSTSAVQDGQEGHGQVVAVAHGHHALTDPVAALAAWRAVRGEAPGTLFTRIWGSSASLEPLSGHVVAPDAPRPCRCCRTRRHPDHRPLSARRPRHRRSLGGRAARSDRRPDTAQRSDRPGEPLDPPTRSARDHLQPGPRPVTGMQPPGAHQFP